MKTTTFTLTAIGIGMMAGITITHHHQVREMVARGGMDSIQPPQNLVNQQTEPTPKLAVSDIAERPSATIYHAPSSDREDALLELLAEMRKEQKKMHKQMAEQNREVAELTFRVDSHSDSFKPLRTDSERPRTLDPAIGPQVPIGDDDHLLPSNPGRTDQH